jgi:hypothetical protein
MFSEEDIKRRVAFWRSSVDWGLMAVMGVCLLGSLTNQKWVVWLLPPIVVFLFGVSLRIRGLRKQLPNLTPMQWIERLQFIIERMERETDSVKQGAAPNTDERDRIIADLAELNRRAPT